MIEECSKVAAIYDIHGNLPALEAVLAEIDRREIETIVVGGDVVLGPMPGDCLDRLMALGARARFVRGNCDRLVVEARDGGDLSALPVPVQETIHWTASQLDRTRRDVLAAFPANVTLRVAGLRDVFFCHATARSDDEIFTVRSDEARVRPMFASVGQPFVVCGHTHMAFDRSIAGRRVMNAGSVGMPYGGTGAHWLSLAADVVPVVTDYDLTGAAARVAATTYPGAMEFARDFILASPSADSMLALLE